MHNEVIIFQNSVKLIVDYMMHLTCICYGGKVQDGLVAYAYNLSPSLHSNMGLEITPVRAHLGLG